MKISKCLIIVTIISLICSLMSARQIKDVDYSVPYVIEKQIKEYNKNLEVSKRLNPYYLRGDYDNDHKVDYAVLVKDIKTGNNGVAFLLSKQKIPIVLGANVAFHEIENLEFNVWYVYGKKKVYMGAGELKIPILKGEAISVVWEEKASALIFWNGFKFVWYQQAD